MLKENHYNTNANGNESQQRKQIDMSIIERIKSMRSQSRENGDTLNQKREDTIKKIQQANVLNVVAGRSY